MGAGSKHNMWTTFTEHRSTLKGPRYANFKTCFVPMNAKATDKLKHKTALAYLVNRFQSPVVEQYFKDRGVAIRPDLFALTELIQWVWRSAIRAQDEREKIHLYLPSERMKTILSNWVLFSDAQIVAGQRLDKEGAA